MGGRSEMLTPRVKRFICAVVVLVLFFGALIGFILWLTLRPHVPNFHIHEFAVPGMTQPAGFVNSRITYNVTIRNRNRHIGIDYDSMFGSVHYKDEPLGSNQIMYPFYQEPKNTTIVYEVVRGASLTGSNNHWMEFTRDRARGLVVFRLEIRSIVRFRANTWGPKHHKMHAKCNVEVGPDGILLPIPEARKCSVHFS